MFTLTEYYPYEDFVLEVDAEQQIKQVLFGAAQHTTLPTVLTGTTTGADSPTTLIDSGATFVTDSVAAGDVVYNSTDQSIAIVKSVDSETQLTCTALVSGTDDTFQTGDSYAVRGVPNQIVLLTVDVGDNKKGFFRRNAGNTAWEEIHQGGGAPIIIDRVDNDLTARTINRTKYRTNSNIKTIGFPNGKTSSCYFQFQLPTSYSNSLDVIMDMLYESTVGGGNVRWQLESWVIADGGDTTPATSPTATTNETTAAPASAEILKKITTTSLKVQGSDLSAGALIVCKLSRLGADAADTETGEVQLHTLQLYQ